MLNRSALFLLMACTGDPTGPLDPVAECDTEPLLVDVWRVHPLPFAEHCHLPIQIPGECETWARHVQETTSGQPHDCDGRAFPFTDLRTGACLFTEVDCFSRGEPFTDPRYGDCSLAAYLGCCEERIGFARACPPGTEVSSE